MIDPPPSPGRSAGRIALAALLAAAILNLGYAAWVGLDADDAENLEATRVLAAARQLTAGPAGLYGPYGESNPYVLIQAPLYYRLTALAAWPLTRLGLAPIPACQLTGRLISALSFAGLLAVAWRLARLGASPGRAGIAAALLVAASPVVAPFAATMRPDLLGVLLQAVGLCLTLEALEPGAPRPTPRLAAAFAAFGLALCVKQHYIAGPALASCALAWAAWRRRLPLAAPVAAPATALAVILLYYGAEEALTAGRMSRSVFVLPGRLQTVTAGSWDNVVLVFATTFKRAAGLILLAAACLVAAPRRALRGRDDALLATFVLAELALMAKLSLDSSGAWYNYALGAIVAGSALVGRALERIAAARPPARRLAPIAVAALVVLAADARLVAHSVALRRGFDADLRALLADPRLARRPPQEIYFAGPLQHRNWRFGRADLMHDEWLYRAFEAVRGAEPRERWLRPALQNGPVRLVVVARRGDDEPDAVDGAAASLAGLGYRPIGRVGPHCLWERRPREHLARAGRRD